MVRTWRYLTITNDNFITIIFQVGWNLILEFLWLNIVRHRLISLIFASDKYEKNSYLSLVIVEHQRLSRHFWKLMTHLFKFNESMFIVCHQKRLFRTFQKSIRKNILVACYVDEKWLTNLGLQVFHLKKMSSFQK